jgi:hypothetical protein
MGFLSNFFKNNKSNPEPPPSLKENYPSGCIEMANNREYLEWFFDVKNDNMGKSLKIMPNCPHCSDTFSCPIGVHVCGYYRLVELGHIKIMPPTSEPEEAATKKPQTHQDQPRSRFTEIDLVDIKED